MGKKGQITIFIIIAVVVISVSSLAYFFYPKINAIGSASDPVYSYLSECIEGAILNSAQIFGYQQGYHTPPAKSLETNSSNIAYYYFEGETNIPRDSFFENELSKIINERVIEECTDFIFFEEDGYLIEFRSPDASTRILEDELRVAVDFPVTAIYGEDVSRFSGFNYNLPIRLGHILDTSRELVEGIKNNPENIDLTFFLNQDLDISINEYDSCNQVYIIVDPESRGWLNEDEYVFSFAAKIDDQYCKV